MWTVIDAKSQLSEILRQARAGEPQVIGSQMPCVVVSMADYQAKFGGGDGDSHDGAWLLRQTAELSAGLTLPSRAEDREVVIAP